MIHPSNVTLAILAGGEGRRMGFAKGLLRVRGRPILAHLLDRLDWRGPTLLVTSPGRENPPAHDRFDREAVDPASGTGPLRGILTALERASTELLAILTTDMPLLESPHVLRLIEATADSPDRLGVMYRRLDKDRAVEPFPLVIRREAAEPIRRRIDSGSRSVRSLLDMPGFLAMDADPAWNPNLWLNLNEPADLTRLERLWNADGGVET